MITIHASMAWTTFIWFYFLAATFTFAQDFTPNPAWRNPNITIPLEERIAIAKSAIDTTLSMVLDGNGQVKFIDTNYADVARLFLQMAQFDQLTKQSIYKDQLLKLFPQAESFRPGFAHSSINWRLEYAIAASQAYVTYSNSSFLEWAKTAWDSGRSYTLSEDELRTGKVSGKNVTMKATCTALTMAGGTFWRNVTNEGFLNTLATATYLVATSLFAEITKNEPMYLTSGYETEAFYFNHLRNSQGDMLDGIDGDTCVPHDGTFPANEGLMMEGLAVLGSVTQAANISDHLWDVVNRTVSSTVWHNEEGIIIEATQQASAERIGQFVVRGLAAIYQRNQTRSNFREYIRQYLGVQYNAVLANARSTGGDQNIYSAPWTGPATASQFDLKNQTNSMSILVAAIPIRDSDPDPTTGGGPTTTDSHNSTPNSHSVNVGAIVGGVIGGLALISLILVATLYLLRRRQIAANTRMQSPTHSYSNDPETMPRVSPIQPLFPVSEKIPPPPNRTSLPTTTISGITGFTGSSEWTSSSDPESFTRLGSTVPTAELVRMLNERLQAGQEWQGDEAPPDYASHVTTRR